MLFSLGSAFIFYIQENDALLSNENQCCKLILYDSERIDEWNTIIKFLFAK